MTPETVRLLNPGFLATLLGHGSLGYAESQENGLPFILAFILPPLVLHKDTRDVLPRAITSKLPEWAHKHSSQLAFLPQHAKELQPSIRSAITVGAHLQIIAFDEEARLNPSERFEPKTKESKEVAEIMKKSYFLGRWLGVSGNQPTILSILGIGV